MADTLAAASSKAPWISLDPPGVSALTKATASLRAAADGDLAAWDQVTQRPWQAMTLNLLRRSISARNASSAATCRARPSFPVLYEVSRMNR